MRRPAPHSWHTLSVSAISTTHSATLSWLGSWNSFTLGGAAPVLMGLPLPVLLSVVSLLLLLWSVLLSFSSWLKCAFTGDRMDSGSAMLARNPSIEDSGDCETGSPRDAHVLDRDVESIRPE